MTDVPSHEERFFYVAGTHPEDGLTSIGQLGRQAQSSCDTHNQGCKQRKPNRQLELTKFRIVIVYVHS